VTLQTKKWMRVHTHGTVNFESA